MELDIKQKNELLTGIVLAQDLTALTEDTRRFMVAKSLDIADGHIKPWSKTLPNTLDNITPFLHLCVALCVMIICK